MVFSTFDVVPKRIRINVFKIGKLWRFRQDDIEDWERRQTGVDEINKLADEIVREMG